jgi:HSP20 family protein
MAVLPVRRPAHGLTVVNPSREFEDIYNRMGQLMNLAFGDFSLLEAGDMTWSPLADLSETDAGYQINVELPGVQKDQIDIQVQEREIVISGEVRETTNGRRHRSTRRTGRFEYRTYLPGDVKADQVSATLSDGALTITAPKSEAAMPRHIEVKA